MTQFEIRSDIPMPVKRLDALAQCVAEAVIAKVYPNAREGAKANIVEYAGEETSDANRLNNQVGNFTRKIINTLAEMGYNNFGETLNEIS